MTLTPLVLLDTKIYLAGADLTGAGNKVMSTAVPVGLDRTTFGSGGSRERVGGLFDTNSTVEGFWAAGDLGQPDDAWWAALGSPNTPYTLVPTGGAVGDLAYLTRALPTAYTMDGEVGQLLAWSASLQGNWPLVRGKVAHPQGTARTATGNGTAQQLGALSATQALYVTLHVLSVAGTSTPTITVAIQDSVDNTFGSPHTSGTFTAATALGGQAMKITGAVTNTWYRPTWTISGTTPSFLFAIAAGIGPK